MYSERTVEKLNAIAREHQSIFLNAIQNTLREMSNTGKGASSVAVDVVPGSTEKSPEIIVTMDDHVLFLDKRKLQWTKLPDVQKLMSWAATKKNTDAEIKKLAWAVAWDKKEKDTWKAKPWRKKSLGSVLKELNVALLKAFDAAVNEDLQDAINRAQ
jgi:hypothetical protein